MNYFEKSLEKLNKFYNIQQDGNFGNNIFLNLKDILPFESGYVFYTNPEKLEYSYNPQIDSLKEIAQPYICEDLKINNTIFGKFIITGEFTPEQIKVFKTCVCIISNLIKNKEISKIMALQTQALQDGYSEIQKSDKLKSDFISHMSHELRTPLTSILGFSDILLNEFIGQLNNKQKEYINDIKVSGLHLLGMVNEILTISKLESGMTNLNRKTFKIKIAIDEVVNMITPLLVDKKHTFKKNIQDDEIFADYQKLQQILFNLLSNAIKYTPENGLIELYGYKTKNNYIITVKDNGIGIDENNQEKIFEKFVELGNEKNSTGLGLTITKKLVEMHNWQISLTSKVNIGSEFNITIPFDFS